ncbi:TetR/AcrR family transcriptional regulator [Occultella kanbiaonis]|uniref:TetR/AcrR family transcriptional regulator n=1 Tax=Occultella kanbiaonis TaxID=2675754 RepID=UPI001A991B6B|nr:TetR/AcrR family transcriptional regulator C-terminal domain-containing protein [Occultella kanbiaonis]
MAEPTARRRAPSRRAPLTRERVIAAAMAVADEKGEAGATMRVIAASLGVEAMSLYNHVRGRDDLLTGMVDAVFAEIDLPDPGAAWRPAMRERALSARAVLRRHTWAVALMDSRSEPGPATLRHHDAVLGVLRSSGFSVAMATHAFSLIDSYVYGFVLQEQGLAATAEEVHDTASAIMEALPTDAFPHLAEVAAAHVTQPGYDYAAEFEFGLDVILGALRPDEG